MMARPTSSRRIKFQMDRRTKIRYPLKCELEFRVRERDFLSESHSGRTVNISSEGFLFTTTERPLVGSEIEVALLWPAALENRIPLKLVMKGEIVRAEGDRIAVRIGSHEYRLAKNRTIKQLALAANSSA